MLLVVHCVCVCNARNAIIMIATEWAPPPPPPPNDLPLLWAATASTCTCTCTFSLLDAGIVLFLQQLRSTPTTTRNLTGRLRRRRRDSPSGSLNHCHCRFSGSSQAMLAELQVVVLALSRPFLQRPTTEANCKRSNKEFPVLVFDSSSCFSFFFSSLLAKGKKKICFHSSSFRFGRLLASEQNEL